MAVNDGPALAGHAAAFEPGYGVLIVQGGFSSAGREAPGLGPDGPGVFQMWAFEPQERRWGLVDQVLEGSVLRGDTDSEAARERILSRRHHALVALGNGRLVLHGGLAAEGAPEALVGVLSRDGGALTCRWSVIDGPGWRAGHRAAVLDIGGRPWVLLAGGVGAELGGDAGASGLAGWAAFTPDGAVAVATEPGIGPVGELRVGLVASVGGLAPTVVAVGTRTHALEARHEGGVVALSSREVPGGLPGPRVAGKVAGVPVALSIGSGEVLEVGPTGATTPRADLAWPAPRHHAGLFMGAGAASWGAMRRGGESSGGVGAWLMGGERASDGAPLFDLWFRAPDESVREGAEPGPHAAWVRVAEDTGVGGRTRFAAARLESAGAGVGDPGSRAAPTFWSARPGPSGVVLARLAAVVVGGQVRWQEVPAVGVGPASVEALGVLDDADGTSVYVVSASAGGLQAHVARVERVDPMAGAGAASVGAVWSLVGEWPLARAVLALGPVGEGPAAELGVAAQVEDGGGFGFEARRLGPLGFGPAVALTLEPGLVGPTAPLSIGVWALGADRGYLVGEGGVWVFDESEGQVGWSPVPGLRPGATALGEDAALWRSVGELVRVPLGCE